MAKHNPFAKSKRVFTGTTGMEANHLPEALPPKKSLLTNLLAKAKRNKTTLTAPLPCFSTPISSSPKPPLFFTLPPELRQQIYTYVFANNGLSDLRQHLIHGRFCLDRRSYTVSLGLRILLVSKRFYADAVPIAYAQSVFYTSFRATEVDGTTSVFPCWSPEVRRHVKHLAIWSDPFSWRRTLGAIESAGMRLRCLTLCDSNINNYMRDEGVNICVAEWLLDIAKWTATLRELHFFLTKINAVFKGAGDLRSAVQQVITADLATGEEMDGDDDERARDTNTFDPETHAITISIISKESRKREVALTIATTTEAEEAGLLKDRGAWDHGDSKGCFKFQNWRKGDGFAGTGAEWTDAYLRWSISLFDSREGAGEGGGRFLSRLVSRPLN
ncbi:hypothetical protein FKW77_005010 [Venturia effusa]|uniref:F-box domain-containing protein n=1 Tax=Venturia effusa TaxID=50376 RepID=A0A517L394_9PEZI|nr:hypothetical protein FKW77_005010 [Venturia effusa]